jgi:hypothetical protein
MYSKGNDYDLNQKLWELFGLDKGENLASCEVSFECGYWRKSNQIHNWFVENVQEGKDDCKDYDVSREQLIKLREICDKVVRILSEQTRKKVMLKDDFSNKEYEHEIYEDTEEIEGLLPTREGFFFGGCEYDEYYLNDMEETITIINKCLGDYDESWDFSYRSSW